MTAMEKLSVFAKTKKIFLGVGVTLALFSILLLSASASEVGVTRYYVDNSNDMYLEGVRFDFTNYVDVNNFGLTVFENASPDEQVSKTFYGRDGNIVPFEHNGRIMQSLYLEPYSTDWYYKDPNWGTNTEIPYDNASAWTVQCYVPFSSVVDGTSLEAAMLDEGNYLTKISMYVNCGFYDYNGHREWTCSLVKTNGQILPLYADSINDLSNQFHQFVVDTKLPLSEYNGFLFTAKSLGMPSPSSTFQLYFGEYTFLEVTNVGKKQEQIVGNNNNTIQGNKDKADQVLNDISVNEPTDADINNIVNHIDDADLSVVNQFGISSIPRSSKFYEFVISASIIFVCLAFCGYMLHGKRG